VTVTGSIVVNGADLIEKRLVGAPVGPPAQTSTSAVSASLFLTQLQGDLAALLDQGLEASNADSAITAALNAEILAQYLPLYPLSGSASTKQTTPSFTIIWLDPVSISLQSPQGLNLSYNLSNNALSNGLGSTFVSVGGNVEMIVMENAAGTFNLDVANVASTAEGGAVELSASGVSSEEFTSGLQSGVTAFELSLGGETGGFASSGSPGGGAGASSTGTPATSDDSNGETVAHSEDPSAASVGGSLTFEGGPSEASSTGSAAAASAAQVGGATGVGQPLPTSYGQRRWGDFNLEPSEGESSGLPLQSILDTVKEVLFRFSGVMDAMGRKSPAAVIRRFGEVLDKLSRPAANNRGAQNNANPGKGQTAPFTILAPASGLTPDPNGIDNALWDHGIEGLLDERLPVDTGRDGSESGALWAAVFLASGLVRSELHERTEVRSPSSRKARPEPRE
jgi:hypothetical protein